MVIATTVQSGPVTPASLTEVTAPRTVNPDPAIVTFCPAPAVNKTEDGTTALTTGVRKVKVGPVPTPPIKVVTTTGPEEGPTEVPEKQVMTMGDTSTGELQARGGVPSVMLAMSAVESARVAEPEIVTARLNSAGAEAGTTKVMAGTGWR